LNPATFPRREPGSSPSVAPASAGPPTRPRYLRPFGRQSPRWSVFPEEVANQHMEVLGGPGSFPPLRCPPTGTSGAPQFGARPAIILAMTDRTTTVTIPGDAPTAVELLLAVRGGDTDRIRRLLSDNPDLARARFEGRGGTSTALHFVAD